MAHAGGTGNGPAESLHAAERPAHHGGEALNAEMVGKARLRMHPIFDRQHRKRSAPRLAGGGIDTSGAGGAEAGADVVDANDEVSVRIHCLARADHVVPPTDVARV